MKPKFQPLSSSWVALHPQPQGVIQFMGGAFFGTFPTLFYRHLFNQLFQAGYTLVALPFRFSFRHWSIALSLLAEQQRLRHLLPAQAHRQGYAADLYAEPASYVWLGHSLGCKYIALLELLSDRSYPAVVAETIGDQTAQWLQQRLADLGQSDICNQPSLLLAPDMSDTTSAIPWKGLARWLDQCQLGVRPTRRQTQALIDRSRLFHLTGLISFGQDGVAGSIQDASADESDVLWLYRHLQDKGLLHQELPGKHLEPMGVRVGRWLVDLNPLDKFAKPLSQWLTGAQVEGFVERLRWRVLTIPAVPMVTVKPGFRPAEASALQAASLPESASASGQESIQESVAVREMEATINDVAS